MFPGHRKCLRLFLSHDSCTSNVYFYFTVVAEHVFNGHVGLGAVLSPYYVPNTTLKRLTAYLLLATIARLYAIKYVHICYRQWVEKWAAVINGNTEKQLIFFLSILLQFDALFSKDTNVIYFLLQRTVLSWMPYVFFFKGPLLVQFDLQHICESNSFIKLYYIYRNSSSDFISRALQETIGSRWWKKHICYSEMVLSLGCVT